MLWKFIRNILDYQAQFLLGIKEEEIKINVGLIRNSDALYGVK